MEFNMKEAIYAIPINDSYDKKCGCPVCRLEKELNDDAVEYIMGAAMMEPDVRIETNKLGFCKTHFSELLLVRNRLSLALMLQSYLGELLDKAFDVDFRKIGKREFEEISAKLTQSESSCFICERVAEKLSHYISNIIFLWMRDEAFREKTRNQPFFCPRHLAMLLEAAKTELPKKSYSAFCEDHLTGTKRELSALSEDVTKFCNSFNYMFRDVPLGDAKTSVERTIAFLNGISDPEITEDEKTS